MILGRQRGPAEVRIGSMQELPELEPPIRQMQKIEKPDPLKDQATGVVVRKRWLLKVKITQLNGVVESDPLPMPL